MILDELKKVKIPVNYVHIKGNEEPQLLYRVIEVFKNNARLFELQSEAIRKIFEDDIDGDLYKIIAERLHKIILTYQTNTFNFNLINGNQWLLRFARQNDINSLIASKDFVPNKILINYPYAYYKDENNNKVLEKEQMFYAWEEPNVKFSINVLKWLFLDTENTFDERLDVASLSCSSYIRNAIINNPWVFTYASEDVRIRVQERLKIPMDKTFRLIGCERYDETRNVAKLIREEVTYPKELIRKINKDNCEIAKLFVSDGDTLASRIEEYVYLHSNYVRPQDENEALTNNIWLLDYLSLEEKKRVLAFLDIEMKDKGPTVVTFDKPIQNQKYKTLFSVEPNLETGKFKSKALVIPEEELDRYRRINYGISDIIFHPEKVTDEKLLELIKSDELVLQQFSWITNFIKSEKLKKEILGQKKR